MFLCRRLSEKSRQQRDAVERCTTDDDDRYRQLGAELGKDNIRVNTIAPGIIDTPIHAKNGIDDSSSLAGLHLLNRIGASEDVAEAVLMLATNDFITGANLRIDGGHSAGHHLG